MSIIKTIAKGIFATIAVFASLMLVMLVILTICWGPFGSGADGAAHATTPTAIPTQVESPVDPHIIVHQDGQNKIVECGKLSVFGDNNVISVMNKDVEKIMITGHGNVITYSRNADPKINDLGNYNDVYQCMLT